MSIEVSFDEEMLCEGLVDESVDSSRYQRRWLPRILRLKVNLT
jgi:hypothetical protein